MKKGLAFVFSFFTFFYFSLNAFCEEASQNNVQPPEFEDSLLQNENISEKSKKIKFPDVELLSKNINYSLKGAISLYNENDWIPRSLIYDLNFNFDMHELEANLGIRHFEDEENLTASIRYSPTFFGAFSAGLEGRFHFLLVQDSFTEIDWLSMVFLRFETGKHFKISGRGGIMMKSAKIFNIESSVPWLRNYNPVFDLNIQWDFNKFISIFFEFDSFTQYKYNLFLAPSIITGVCLNPSKRLSIGSEIEFCYIDLFTLSGYLSSIYHRAFIKYRF